MGRPLQDMVFTAEGLLPPEDYVGCLDELRASLLVRGPDGATLADWNPSWRLQLVDNLEILARQLWQVGIGPISIDGSFAEDKAHPNDIDGHFECDLHELASGRLESRLNRLDPHKIWTWDPAARSHFRGYPKKQLPMWHRYRVELYPHYGQGTGVRDALGYEYEFPALFRQTRAGGHRKGIVVLTPN